jgi:hypothetical protein
MGPYPGSTQTPRTTSAWPHKCSSGLAPPWAAARSGWKIRRCRLELLHSAAGSVKNIFKSYKNKYIDNVEKRADPAYSLE